MFKQTKGEKMDTTKWKSVLVPKEIYEDIRTEARNEGRKIGTQLRLIFESYKKQELKKG